MEQRSYHCQKPTPTGIYQIKSPFFGKCLHVPGQLPPSRHPSLLPHFFLNISQVARPQWYVVVTLSGKGERKVTLITAYNASNTPGDTTFYQQQVRILSRLHRESNQSVNPQPCRQFVLDLQAWIQYIQKQGHDIILSLDANEAYDPD
jgi:hypothetical protein